MCLNDKKAAVSFDLALDPDRITEIYYARKTSPADATSYPSLDTAQTKDKTQHHCWSVSAEAPSELGYFTSRDAG